MQAKLYPPDAAVKQMDVNGHRYEQRGYDGPLIVDNAKDERALLKSGCWRGTLTVHSRPTRRAGCIACGHKVFHRPPEIRGRRCMGCGLEQ